MLLLLLTTQKQEEEELVVVDAGSAVAGRMPTTLLMPPALGGSRSVSRSRAGPERGALRPLARAFRSLASPGAAGAWATRARERLRQSTLSRTLARRKLFCGKPHRKEAGRSKKKKKKTWPDSSHFSFSSPAESFLFIALSAGIERENEHAPVVLACGEQQARSSSSSSCSADSSFVLRINSTPIISFSSCSSSSSIG